MMKTTKKLLALILAIMMLTSAFALPASAASLSAPAQLTSVQNTSAIKLSWSKVSGATGYRIYYKLPGDISWRVGLSSTAATTYTFKNLPEGQHYIFAVRSYVKSGNTVIWGGYTQIKTATQTAAPAKIIAEQSTSAIRLTWSKVESAYGYVIYYKTSATDSWKIAVADTTKTTHTFNKLPAGKKYIFAVRSYSKSTIGKFGGKYSTVETATKPATPVVKATSGNNYITLSWNKVNADGYRIYYKTPSTDWKVAVSSTTKTTHTFKNINAKTVYTFAVRPYIKTTYGVIWGGHNESFVGMLETKDAIVAAYVNGVNQLKNTPNFLLNKNDKLDIEIDEITGGSAVENVANTLIPKPEPESYTFLGGTDAASGKTPNQVIAPLNVPAKVDINAVTRAVSRRNADGGYTVQLTIKEEQQTLDMPAPNLSTMVEVIDIPSLIPDGFTLEMVNINYSPSTITAVFDSQGRIVSMQHTLVSQGSGSGIAKILVNIPASMTMHGTFTSDYTINYY